MSTCCRNYDEMIHLFVDGELSGRQREAFLESLRRDERLQDEVARYRRIIRTLKVFAKLKFPSDRLRKARAALVRRVSGLS